MTRAAPIIRNQNVGGPKPQQGLAAHRHDKPIHSNDQRNTQPFWPQGFPIGVFPKGKSRLYTMSSAKKPIKSRPEKAKSRARSATNTNNEAVSSSYVGTEPNNCICVNKANLIFHDARQMQHNEQDLMYGTKAFSQGWSFRSIQP